LKGPSTSLFPEPAGKLGLLGLFMLVCFAIVLAVMFGWDSVVFSVGLILLWLIVRDTLWTLTVLILLYFYIVHTTEEITPAEMSFAVLFFFFTVSWYFRAVFIEHRPIIQTAADRLLVGFLALGALSIIPALLYGNSLFLWLRELASLSIFALFFPMKAALKERKALPVFLVAYMVMATLLAIEAIYNYKISALQAVFLYQFQSSRQVEDEQVFLAVVIASGAFVMYAQKWKQLILSIAIFALFAMALAVSFSRGYWVAAAAGLFIVFLIAGFRQKVQAVGLGIAMVGLAVMALVFLFGGLWETITGSMGSRLLTLTSASRDISVQSRVSEYASAWATSIADPVVGHGLGATFVFYDPIRQVHLVRNFTHNSYIYLILKLGLAGLLLFVSFLILQIYMAWRLFRNSRGMLRPFIGALFAILVSLAIVSVSSPLILQRNSLLIFLLSFSIVSALYESQDTKTWPQGETS
jgi:O-antigen ligase